MLITGHRYEKAVSHSDIMHFLLVVIVFMPSSIEVSKLQVKSQARILQITEKSISLSAINEDHF